MLRLERYTGSLTVEVQCLICRGNGRDRRGRSCGECDGSGRMRLRAIVPDCDTSHKPAAPPFAGASCNLCGFVVCGSSECAREHAGSHPDRPDPLAPEWEPSAEDTRARDERRAEFGVVRPDDDAIAF